jgi:hypothetical protein
MTTTSRTPPAPPAVPLGVTALELPTPSSASEELLLGLLLNVVRTHAPGAAAALSGERLDRGGTPESIERSLQVIGTWAQLLSIAELHDVMRARRRLETEPGRGEDGGQAHAGDGRRGA